MDANDTLTSERFERTRQTFTIPLEDEALLPPPRTPWERTEVEPIGERIRQAAVSFRSRVGTRPTVVELGRRQRDEARRTMVERAGRDELPLWIDGLRVVVRAVASRLEVG
jgi:hypothetical protein